MKTSKASLTEELNAIEDEFRARSPARLGHAIARVFRRRLEAELMLRGVGDEGVREAWDSLVFHGEVILRELEEEQE